MIRKPHHRPFPEDPRDGILDHRAGVLIDNPKDRGDVLAEGIGFGPPGKSGCHRVQKRHPPLAVGRDHGIPDTGQGRVEPLLTVGQWREVHTRTSRED